MGRKKPSTHLRVPRRMASAGTGPQSHSGGRGRSPPNVSREICLPKFKVVDAASAFLTRPLYQIACPWLLWVLQGPHCRAGLVGVAGQALPGCF